MLENTFLEEIQAMRKETYSIIKINPVPQWKKLLLIEYHDYEVTFVWREKIHKTFFFDSMIENEPNLSIERYIRERIRTPRETQKIKKMLEKEGKSFTGSIYDTHLDEVIEKTMGIIDKIKDENRKPRKTTKTG